MDNTNNWVNKYLRWLTDNLTETNLADGLSEISTPFVDRFGDGITVYVKKDKNSRALTLSDDFALVNNTISIGENPSLQKINALQVFLSPYGITVTKDGELQMSAHEDDYPVNLHLFIQALVSANDMFAPRYKQGSKANIFMDDIAAFLDSKDVPYTPNIKLEGQSGIIHQVGFILPKRRQQPERLIYALNKPTAQNVELTLFKWGDIQRKRGDNSHMIAFLNDEGTTIPNQLVNAFNSYGALPVPWSERETYLDELAV